MSKQCQGCAARSSSCLAAAVRPRRAAAEGAINVPGNRLELNARLAASLDAPVLMVLDANSATGVDDLVNKALVSRNGLTEERAEVMGLIVNKVTSPADTTDPGLPERPHRGAR